MSTMVDDMSLNVGDSIFGGSPLLDDDLSSPAPSQADEIGPAAFAPAPPLRPVSPAAAAAGTGGPGPVFAPQVGPVPGPFSITRPLSDGDVGGAPANVGRALLLVGLGATLGYTQLGLKGLLVGGLWGGAASNAWSAAVSTPEERVRAGTWAVIEGGAAAYLTWSALKKDSTP